MGHRHPTNGKLRISPVGCNASHCVSLWCRADSQRKGKTCWFTWGLLRQSTAELEAAGGASMMLHFAISLPPWRLPT